MSLPNRLFSAGLPEFEEDTSWFPGYPKGKGHSSPGRLLIG